MYFIICRNECLFYKNILIDYEMYELIKYMLEKNVLRLFEFMEDVFDLYVILF